MSTRVYAVSRPYVVTIGDMSFPASSDDAQRTLDAYPVVKFSPDLVVLRAGDRPSIRVRLVPATLGGGPAFVR